MLARSTAHPSTSDASPVTNSQPIRIPASKHRAIPQRHATTAGNTAPPQSHTPPQYTGEEEEDEEEQQQVEDVGDEHEHTAFSVSLPHPSSPSQSLPLSSIPTIPGPSPSSTSPLSSSQSPPLSAAASSTATYDPHPEHVGETIASFTLLSVIGRGGYGKVFLAQHDITHRLYALKVMKKSLLAQKNITSAAIQEKHILSLLRHPSLVTLRYAFQSPSKLYLVMDYVAGGELFGRLDGCAGRRMLEREVVFYTAEIVVALEWLHERGIIYRDLKPENILLDRRGHVVLSDFGFAKSCIVEPTQTNSFLGTTHAMSPEMINGSGHGKGTDWWALGVLITELLTGRPPWSAGDKKKLQEMIVSGPLHLPKYLSIPAKSVIQGLLKRTIDKRLGCGDDGVAAIKHHAFFANVNWQKVAERKMKAPWVPPLSSERDVSMFDTQFTSEGVCDSPSSVRGRAATVDTEEEEKERVRGFEGFSYTSSPYMGDAHGQLLDRSQEIGITVGSVSNFLLASPSTTPSQHHSPLIDTALNRKLMAQRAKEKAREMEEEKEEKEKEKEKEKERDRRKDKEDKKLKKQQEKEERERKEKEEAERMRRLEEEEFQRKQQEEQQRIKQQQLEEEQRKKAAAAATTTPPPTTPSRPISQLSAQLAQRQAALPSPIKSASGVKLAPWAHKAAVATTPPAASITTTTVITARPIQSSISSPAISTLRHLQPQPQLAHHQPAQDFAPHIPITARLFPTLEASTQPTRSPAGSLSGGSGGSVVTPKSGAAAGGAAETTTPKAKTTWARLF